MDCHLNRRQLLTAILGTPAVMLSGCSTRRLPPAGEIVGPSVAVGHRVRDGETHAVVARSPAPVVARSPDRATAPTAGLPQPPAGAWSDVGVLIVGGGIAGLCAAWRMQQAGVHDYLLLELETAAGGTSRSGESDLTAYPWGAHYLPLPFRENRALVRLLAEMGVLERIADDGTPVAGEQFLCRDPHERLFFRGEWIDGLYPASGASAEDRRQWERFHKEIDRWVNWRDERGRRAFAIPTAAASDDPHVMQLDSLSMVDWLRQHGFTSERLHWVVDYSCRDDYGLTADQTSAWAGLFYFASRARESSRAPQPLLTWPAGNGHIVDYLAREAGPRVRTGHAALRIAPQGGRGWTAGKPRSLDRRGFAKPPAPATQVVARSPDRATAPDQVVARSPDRATAPDRRSPDAAAATLPLMEAVVLDVAADRVYGIRAEQVIFAAPQFVAARMIGGFDNERRSAAQSFQYGSWLVANLHLRSRPAERQFPLCWDNVLYDSRSLGYVVATHQTGIDYGPTVLTWFYPFCDRNPAVARQTLLDMTWDDCAELALSDLEAAHPEIRELVTRLDAMRWGHAMVQPRPGFIGSDARRLAARPFGSIHFAGTDLSGVPLMEEAFYHGVRAAEEVLASRGVISESIL